MISSSIDIYIDDITPMTYIVYSHTYVSECD